MQKLTQPSHNTCVITCLAMLTGRPTDDEELMAIHEVLWSAPGGNMASILDHLKIVHRPRVDRDHIEAGKCYLVTVPSLNTPGSFHQVIFDARNGLEVLDPAEGYEGKLFYTRDDAAPPGSVPLTSWIVDFEVEPHDRKDPYPTA